MLAFALLTSENEIPLRDNTCTRIFTTRGYGSPMKTLDPDYLAPKQVFKLDQKVRRFGWFCLCLCRISFSFDRLRLCLRACVASENQA